jgi:hypothetical protein
MCKPDETIWSVSLAKLRMEGFFYLENTGAAGMVETKSFILEGADLEINADASAQSAELILAIMDDQGGQLPGLPPRMRCRLKRMVAICVRHGVKDRWPNYRGG